MPSTLMRPHFLDEYKQKRKSTEADEVDMYLNDGPGDLKSLERFPSIKWSYM